MSKHIVFFVAAGLALAAFAGSAHAQSSASPYTSATRYDLMGRVTGTISPNAPSQGYNNFLATRTTYDAAGRPTKVESGYLSSWQSETVTPASWTGFTIIKTIETTYNAQNQKLTERVKGTDLATYSLTQYSYDTSGRLLCTAVRMYPAAYGSLPAACTLGTEGSYGPDRITKHIYDAAGQLVQVREGVGAGSTIEAAEVTYTYTNNGKIKFVIDSAGNKAERRYDGYDRQVRWVFPALCKPGTCGLPVFDDSTPANAVATAGPLNESDYELYEYDNNGIGNGNRTKLRKRDGQELTYQYDFLNRNTVKIVPGSTTHTRDVYYSYDLRGLMTSARFDSTSGEGLTLGYDGFGRKTTETLLMDGISRTLASLYDQNSNRTRLTWPDPFSVNYYRDGLDRLYYADFTGANPLFYPIFDAAGRMSILYRWRPGVGWEQYSQYGHDNVSRLETLVHNPNNATHDVTTTFAYNPANQLTSSTRTNDIYAWPGQVAVNRNYTANGLNEYSAVAGISFAYDANGNLTWDGTYTYAYDVENRLVSRSGGAGTHTLRYDPLGRLYETASATIVIRFLHDGDALVAEYGSDGSLWSRYIHGTATGDDPLVWFAGSSVADSIRRYLYADERGSIVAVTDSAGAVLAVNKFDEYGIPSGLYGRFQYTGQVWITGVGLYYYKARMYSPTLGRFLQTDPIGYDDQFNLYAYVGNDPLNGLDPTGTEQINVDRIAKEAVMVMEVSISDPTGAYPVTVSQIQSDMGGVLTAKTSGGVELSMAISEGTGPGAVVITVDPTLNQSSPVGAQRPHIDKIGGDAVSVAPSSGTDVIGHELVHGGGGGDQYAGGVGVDGTVLTQDAPNSAGSIMRTLSGTLNTQSADEMMNAPTNNVVNIPWPVHRTSPR